LNLREIVNRNAGVVIGTTVVVVIIASALAWRTFSGPPEAFQKPKLQKMAYWYDLNTKELFEAPLTEDMEMETDSGPYEGGPAGVRAKVYSCGNCRENRFIGWLEKRNPEVKGQVLDELQLSRAFLVRSEDGDQWVPLSSPAGQRIINSVDDRCATGELKKCWPHSRRAE